MHQLSFGDTSVFAIESGIEEAYERLSFLALGYFVIHVGGLCYGRRSSSSTMLACSFNAVEKRITQRGKHAASFARQESGQIAEAFRSAIYGDIQRDKYFGIPLNEFSEMFFEPSSDLKWAPDGDEAFDDGSYVLQFDIDDRVRLVAFRSCEGGGYKSDTLRDVWLPADVFYGILRQWHDAFHDEWQKMAKIR